MNINNIFKRSPILSKNIKISNDYMVILKENLELDNKMESLEKFS